MSSQTTSTMENDRNGATSPKEDGSSALVADERLAVARRAKLHLRSLQAELLFLQESGALNNDVKELLYSLIAIAPPDPPKHSKVRKPSGPPTEVLATPKVFSIVASGYPITNSEQLLAHPGDRVVVYAWVNGKKEAIAFNQQNDMAGRVLTRFLKEDDPQPVIESDVFKALSAYGENLPSRKFLTWNAGDHIKVCKWSDNYKTSGIGFNPITKRIGRFSVVVGDIKIIDLDA